MNKKDLIRNFTDEGSRITFERLNARYVKHSLVDEIRYSNENPSIGFNYSKKNLKGIDIEILGEKFTLPESLAHILEELEYSKGISYSFTNNWDDEGAKSVPTRVYSTAVRFLVVYSKTLDKQGIIIDAPEINPTPNGAIDLSWRTEDARLLIKFKEVEENKIGAKFYGDHYVDGTDKSGSVEIDSFDSSLLEWMKILKK
ncbi:hypothetical protein [Sphingobacterium cellulitidis]|uniref:hypothetical protein n=1 Tax=Sphingobacterium cellulitidis TaxID=1768011 RepID=UPI000B93C4A3|nr:hypothetical protein CHT99_02910 [Sphingobacterium cellulitidis]